MILNQLQPTFAAKTVTNEKIMFESHAEICLDWMGFIFNPKNFEQSATQNFGQPLITLSRTSVLSFK